MRSREVVIVRLCALFSLCSPALGHAEDADCGQIIEEGVLNARTVLSKNSSRESFTAWQCAFDLSTHKQALELGIGVGVPVYGVPLKANGVFTQAERDTWRRNNCQEVDKTVTATARYKEAINWVDPSIVSAWTTCKALKSAKAARAGLKCGIEKDDSVDALFSFWLQYVPSNAADDEPLLTEYVQLEGAGCKNLSTLAPRAKVPYGGKAIQCGRTLKEDQYPAVRITINTTKGKCDAKLPAAAPHVACDKIVNGTTTVSGHTVWQTNCVKFEQGSKVIVKDGGTLIIKANYVIAGDGAVIDGTGTQGAPGQQGRCSQGGSLPPGPPGCGPVNWNAGTDDDYFHANSDCDNNYGHFDNGQAGGPGSEGGPGATIVVNARKLVGDLSCKVDGGAGGSGGQGGRGVRHVRPNGDIFDCHQGSRGSDGRKGPDGSCSLP